MLAKFHSKNNEDTIERLPNVDKFDQDIKAYESFLSDERAIQYLPKYAILLNNIAEYWINTRRDDKKALECYEKELSYVLKWFEYNNEKLDIVSYDKFKKEFEIHLKEWNEYDDRWQFFNSEWNTGRTLMDSTLGAFGYWGNFIYSWFMFDKERQLSSDERKTVIELLDICNSLIRIYDCCSAFSEDHVKADDYQKKLENTARYTIDALKTIIRVDNLNKNNSEKNVNKTKSYKDNINFSGNYLSYDILNVLGKLDSGDGYNTIYYLLEFIAVHNDKDNAIKLFNDYCKYLEKNENYSALVIRTLEKFTEALCEVNTYQEAIDAYEIACRIASENCITKPQKTIRLKLAYQQINGDKDE